MVVFGTSIGSLQRMGWRQIDLLAEEVISRSPAWRCTIMGLLEQNGYDLFALAANRFPKLLWEIIWRSFFAVMGTDSLLACNRLVAGAVLDGVHGRGSLGYLRVADRGG